MKKIVLILALSIVCFPLFTWAQAPVTAQDIQTKYATGKKIKILIVPGHDEEFSGAEYKGVKEADLTLQVANNFKSFLATDKQIQTYVTRDSITYTNELLNYFWDEADAIKTFIAEHKAQTKQSEQQNGVDVGYQVPHATAPNNVFLRLYGLNKWADEKKYDLVIHIHFNDYGSRDKNLPGDYGGYAVYVPQTGLINASSSQQVGSAIAKRLFDMLSPTTMTGEQIKADSKGMIQDYELIALGVSNTLTIPSVLVEYSYIYEPQVINKTLFPTTARLVAQNTARGIEDFLNGTKAAAVVKQDPFRYTWSSDIGEGTKAKPDVLALQYALKNTGFYPGTNKTQNDCPFTGVFGTCTKQALKAFQQSKNLAATGYVGPQTRAILNALFK